LGADDRVVGRFGEGGTEQRELLSGTPKLTAVVDDAPVGCEVLDQEGLPDTPPAGDRDTLGAARRPEALEGSQLALSIYELHACPTLY